MDLAFLFTLPILKLSIKIAIGCSFTFLFVQILRWAFQSSPRNPFEKDDRKLRKPYVHDQKKRNEVIAQSFNRNKIPSDLDAIVIGSGIGGLTTAAIMAKSGKRVLVLEQHDQAGGCCHTFIDKGYEFDVGIHYIGEMNVQSRNKTLMDQISEGQVEWVPLDDEYDVVSIGYGEENRKYPISFGIDNWQQMLKEKFPEEEEAIIKYFDLIRRCGRSSTVQGIIKLLPMWLSRIVLSTGLLKLVSNIYDESYCGRTSDIVNGLTENKDLRTIFTYCWGDYGTPPSRSNFFMQALLNNHFMSCGASYPKGGASEIAYNMIPVIERTGGKVLVRADVTGIVHKNGKVCGVNVKKGSEEVEIIAPMVISSAGLYNTFLRLLPKEIAEKSYFTKLAHEMKPGIAAMNVFLGLNCSNEELKVKKQNIWAFTGPDTDAAALKYFDCTSEKAMDEKVPLMFISFPSAKDPEWKNHPGRADKATCAIVTLANWQWFKEWENKGVKKRGDDYDELKKTIGDQMIEQTCLLFPQIRDKIDFIEIGSPVTNKHYLGQPHGEIYGLDHTIERMEPYTVAKLRPETDIPGLYLTGQDILSCGFTGALFAGVLTAQAVLGRNVMKDLMTLHSKIVKSEKAKQKGE